MDDRPKRKRKNWSKADEIRLLGIWEENVKDLKKCRRNSHIYSRMASNFHDHTAEEVHIKISNFSQRYRAEKRLSDVPGASPSSWKYYAIVDRIIGDSRETFNIEDMGEIEELPEEYSFKEEASSDMTSCSSSPTPTPTAPVNLSQHLANATAPIMPLFIPPSLSGSQDSPASSPLPPVPKAGPKRKPDRTTFQKEALKIARENQRLLRDQIAFSREAIKEQLNMIAHSIDLIRESTENSRNFSIKICEISERQLELENHFMGFMKEVLSKRVKRKRKKTT